MMDIKIKMKLHTTSRQHDAGLNEWPR